MHDNRVELDEPQPPLEQQITEPRGELRRRVEVEGIAASSAGQHAGAPQGPDRIGDPRGVGRQGDDGCIAQ